jgi:hypothetical protein
MASITGKRAATPARAAAARANGKKGGRPSLKGTDVAMYAGIGEVPKDVLEIQRWMHRLSALQLKQIAQDEQLTPKERRSEMRQAMKTAAALVPAAAIRAALRMLNQAQDQQRDEDPGVEATELGDAGGESLRLE